MNFKLPNLSKFNPFNRFSSYTPLNRDYSMFNTLNPTFKTALLAMLKDLRMRGFEYKIISAERSPAVQQNLYAQGRTIPGKIVTTAQPGDSKHQYGHAADFMPIIDSKLKNKNNLIEEGYRQLGLTAPKFGLVSGYNWTKFVDKPHVQSNVPLTTLKKQNPKIWASAQPFRTDVTGTLPIATYNQNTPTQVVTNYDRPDISEQVNFENTPDVYSSPVNDNVSLINKESYNNASTDDYGYTNSSIDSSINNESDYMLDEQNSSDNEII